jgi:uncharacterized phage-associated protein
METAEKVLYFDYVIKRLMDWHVEETGLYETNDLSKLKVMQLLYFIVSADTVCGTSMLAEKVFTKFCVMKYGHVELDIYDFMKTYNGATYSYRIDRYSTEWYREQPAEYLLEGPMRAIDTALAYLRQINGNLIRMNGSEFIRLSRSWDSWKQFMGRDKTHTRLSWPVPAYYMQVEEKRFGSLQ